MPLISDDSIIINNTGTSANGELRLKTSDFISDDLESSGYLYDNFGINYVFKQTYFQSGVVIGTIGSNPGFSSAISEGLFCVHGGYYRDSDLDSNTSLTNITNDISVYNMKYGIFQEEVRSASNTYSLNFQQSTGYADTYQVAEIDYANTSNQTSFGYSVAAGSGVIVVGDPFQSHFSHVYTARGFSYDGKAYIYSLGGKLIKELTSPDIYGDQPDGWPSEFGTSVAAGCGRVVIGEPRWDTLEFNPGYGSNSPGWGGRACIYDTKGNLINIMRPLLPDASGSGWFGLRARFGISVAVGCGRIAVLSEERGSDAKVWIYDLDGHYLDVIHTFDGSKVLSKYVEDGTPSPLQYRSHNRIAIADGRIYVGDSRADHIEANGGGTTTNVGCVHAFDLDGNYKWTRYISGLDENTPSSFPSGISPAGSHLFGDAVAASDGFVAVGSPGYYPAGGVATWGSTGLFMLFTSDGEYVKHQVRLIDDANQDNTGYKGKDQFFGQHISFKDGLLAVGAPYYDVSRGSVGFYSLPIQRHFLDIL